MNTQRYSAYKDSGIAWLGEIPAHWRIRRLKNISQLEVSNVDKKSKEDEIGIQLCNYVDVYYQETISSNMEFMSATAAQHQADRFKLRQNDVLITKDSETPDDIAISALVTEDMDSVLCGYHLAQIRPNFGEVTGGFLHRAFAAHPIQCQFHIAANGVTRYGLSKHDINSSQFPIPPELEQQAIAAWLDEQTGKLDRVIANKREQIKQLETLRKVTIHDAVTKGLNPDAPMKDSGIPWLGEIPAHWEVRRLSQIADLLQTGPFGSQLHSEEYVEGGIPVINPSHLIGGKLVPDSAVTVDSDTHFRLQRHALLEGDIVFARRGEMGRCGLVTVSEAGWLCGTGSLLYRPLRSRVFSKYMAQVLASRGIKETLELESVGSTMDNLNTEILGALKVPLPPVDEQVLIHKEVEKRLTALQKLEINVTEQIKQLETLRKVTIQDAVTGKIRVPGVEV